MMMEESTLRKMIRKLILESQSVITPEQEKKIISLMKDQGGVNQALAIANALDETWIDTAFRKPIVMEAIWKAICEAHGSWGSWEDMSQYGGSYQLRLDIHPIEEFFQRGGQFYVDTQTLEIKDVTGTFWKYIAYYDGDTDWEDFTPPEIKNWIRKYQGVVLTPEIADELAKDFKALSDKHPMK